MRLNVIGGICLPRKLTPKSSRALMHIREEGESGTVSHSESSHDIRRFFPVPKNSLCMWHRTQKIKKKWSRSGQTIRQVGKKPPCLVVLSKCLFQKTDWMESGHSTLTTRTKCNQKVLNHFAVSSSKHVWPNPRVIV